MDKKIMGIKSMTAILAASVFLTGCGAGHTTGTSDQGETASTANVAEANRNTECVGYSLVTNVYGDGQKPWYVVLEYDEEISSDSVETGDFEVEGYDIQAVYVSREAAISGESEDGKYVIIELSTDYTTSNYGGGGSSADGQDSVSGKPDDGDHESGRPSGEISGDISGGMKDKERDGGSSGEGDENGFNTGTEGGPGASFALEDSNKLSVTFLQVGEIATAGGNVIPGDQVRYTTEYTENTNLLVDNFTLDVFEAEDGTELMYSVYLPESYDDGTEYPLVLFMPDATGEGNDVYRALTGSLGGVVWAEEEWQEEHPAIVLVPQYTDANSGDDAYTMELVKDVMRQYSVNEDRLYLAGQSAGTIRSLKLLIHHPDTFAGAMLIAGQADSGYEELLAQLKDQHIWFVASAGDARAYPGIQAIVDAVEEEGTEVTISQWSARLPDEEQEALVEKMVASGTTINWTIYDAGTVMKDDVSVSDATEHMNTWRVAYNLDTVREWLFAQTR